MATLGIQIALSALVASSLGTAPGSAALTSIAALLALTLVLIVLFIIALVFYFIGFGYTYAGRYEFAPPHPRNLRVSLYALIFGIAIGVVEMIVVSALLVSALLPGLIGPSDPTAVFNAVRSAIVATIVLDSVLALCAAFTLILTVRSLTRPGQNLLLYVAGSLGAITPAAVGALTLSQISRLFAAAGSAEFDYGAGMPTLTASGLGLATMLLYFGVYRSVRQRIQSGELAPVVAPPPPTPWMPMPVAPYPPPAQPPPGGPP